MIAGETMSDTMKHFYAEKPDDLLDTQRDVVKIILKRYSGIIHSIVSQTGWTGTPTAGTLPGQGAIIVQPDNDQSALLINEWNTIDFVRPHQTFTVDGARGSGKTYVLLTIANAINELSNKWRTFRKDSGEFATNTWVARLQDFDPPGASRYGHLAMVVRIIIPSDMERQECVMERIFDFMNDKISKTRTWYQNNQLANSQKAQKLLDSLQTELREVIMPGWHFARETGREIIIRDAVDYNDYIGRFEQESHKAVEKIGKWREFLVRFLEAFGTATLTVFLDDSDVQPWIIDDILHTVRMYLNHPRIVTVLAGNVRSMRDVLIDGAMRELAKSMGALSDRGSRTASDWRRIKRRAVEDFLEKVLPLSQRLFIAQPSPAGAAESDDFKKITRSTLNELCYDMLGELRPKFLGHKFRLATLRAAGRSDRPEYTRQSLQLNERASDVRRSLEDYISWWLFSNWYKDELAPRSARQIVTFRDYYTYGKKSKRLIIALYENPANYTVIQQLRDTDANVHRWLQDQELDSEWVGPRRFHINGRMLDHGQFAYDYVRFRLDIGLAAPTRLNAEEAVPLNLLPVPRGRTHIRRFFQPNAMQRRQRRLGVCRWIDHAVIPSNCIYVRDLDALPDRSLLKGRSSDLRARRSESALPGHGRAITSSAVDGSENVVNRRRDAYAGLGQGHWEAWLAENWMDLIDDEQDEESYRYFTGIVCASQRSMAGVQTSELLSLLDGPTMIREHREGSYESFLEIEFDRFSNAVEAADPRERNPPKDYTPVEFAHWVLPKQKEAELIRGMDDALWQKRKISRARYAALINDVRRAWHAIRVFDLATLGRAVNLSAALEGREDERAAFGVLATQDRLKLYMADDITKLFDSVPWSQEYLAAFSPDARKSKFKEGLHDLLQKATTGNFMAFSSEQYPGDELTSRANWRSLSKRALEHGIREGSKAETDQAWTIKELCAVGALFDPEYNKDLDSSNEIEDYRRWVTTLRAVGRICCSTWPDLGVADDADRRIRDGADNFPHLIGSFANDRSNFEGKLLPQSKDRFGPLAVATKRTAVAAPAAQTPDEAEESKKAVLLARARTAMTAKSVRNFVFLLYGLAPSLSALLHCELMGIIWQWQRNFFEVPSTEITRFTELKRRFDTLPASNSTQIKARLTRLRDDLELFYSENCLPLDSRARISDKMYEWANLIAGLAMVLRYVRAKYLQLHFMIWLQNIHDTEERIVEELKKKPEFKDLKEDPEERARKMFWSDVSQHLPGLDEVFQKLFRTKAGDLLDSTIIQNLVFMLRSRFIKEDHEIDTTLSILSDAASSSVFGDRWLEDTIVSLHKSEMLDVNIELRELGMPLELMKADGIFPETEQWLWAANRCLRKFQFKFQQRSENWKGLNPDEVYHLRRSIEHRLAT
jgi:hypothetical protein